MHDDSPRLVNNALRQAVIGCVKGELQQPYNLGVITREQFVKVCSSITKEFLKEAAPGQAALTPSNEAHLRARTTALLTKQIGGDESPDVHAAPARQERDDVQQHRLQQPSPAYSKRDQQQQQQQQQQQAQNPHTTQNNSTQNIGGHSGTQSREYRDFYKGAAETPGAVLAATDNEVLKYQDHLARLSSLTGVRGATPPGSVGRYRGEGSGSAPVALEDGAGQYRHEHSSGYLHEDEGEVSGHQVAQQQQMPQQFFPPADPVGSGGVGIGGAGGSVPAGNNTHNVSDHTHKAAVAATARDLHTEILSHVDSIESLHALIKNHLAVCEAAM